MKPSLAKKSDLALRTVAGMGAAPRGPFDGRVGPNRRFATAERPFAMFRGIKASLGGTVNDVVLTATLSTPGGDYTLSGRKFYTTGSLFAARRAGADVDVAEQVLADLLGDLLA